MQTTGWKKGETRKGNFSRKRIAKILCVMQDRGKQASFFSENIYIFWPRRTQICHALEYEGLPHLPMA